MNEKGIAIMDTRCQNEKMTMSRRDFGIAACGTALALKLPLDTAAQSGPSQAGGKESEAIDPASLVDPELLPFLQPFIAAAAKEPHPVRTLASYRTGSAAAQEKYAFSPSPPVEDRTVSGLPGQPDVRVFIVGAAPGKLKPAMLHVHGGGYITGHAGDAVPNMQKAATRFGCVAMSVDYRLAPETPFPGPLNDNYAALLWLHRHAAELGVDPDRIIVAGESAGGGHAAILAIAARDRGEVRLRAQILTYPMLDDRTGTSRPVPHHVGAFVWRPEDNRFGWSSMLGQPAGGDTAPSGSVPARVVDLRGLPPTFIGVGSLDLFVEEDMEYARRLLDAGVPAELYVAPGAYHGFEAFVPEAEVSMIFREARDGAIRRAFST